MNHWLSLSLSSSLLSAALALAGCRAGDEPSDSPEAPSTARSADTGSRATATATEDASSEDLAAIASSLRARHADDLPSAEELAKYPSAEASLRELARTADTMVVRTRALALLQHFSSEPTGALLTELAADPELHPALRAAALTGLAGQPLDDQPARVEQLEAALRDADPRVVAAAVATLQTCASGQRVLARARDERIIPD